MLVHECVHAIFNQDPTGVEADADERLVVMLGLAVLDLLRRNPHPVTYLTKAVSP